MLDRLKLVKQITANVTNIAYQQDNKFERVLQIWRQIIADQHFKTQLLVAKLNFSVPDWQGELGQVLQIDSQKVSYTIVASDGSQIYPDRHMGSNFYLINTGIAIIRYNENASADFSSEPYFFTNLDGFEGNIADYVDSKRHELEIADGLKKIINESAPLIYLADGSLIAWHLFGKGENLQDRFTPTYLQQLEKFYTQQIPFVGYISLPNSTELVNLVRAKVCNFKISKDENWDLNSVTDADLMTAILQPGQFTNWFYSNVAAAKNYPEHLRPHFAYYHTGNEIARIEVPAWIVNDQDLLYFCMQVIVDQACKGYGYPVVLAEAHQQAVVKTPDRNFFYQVINQITTNRVTNNNISRKLKQKKIMPI